MNSKSFKKYEAIIGSSQFVIEEDKPEVGYYLYVYEDGVCIKDYLQDDLKSAMEQAEEEFSVPQNSWKQI